MKQICSSGPSSQKVIDGESRAGDGESRALLATSCWLAGLEKKKVGFVR